MSDAPTTPAGWYPNPSQPGTTRYWDGNAWTDQIQSATPAAPPPPPSYGAAPAPAPAPAPYGGPVGPPTGANLSSLGRRFGGALLEGLLAVVTLGIGWLIWSCFTFSDGQTPAKKILGMKIVKADSGEQLTWGGMFVREFLIRGLLMSLISTITFGIGTLVAVVMIFGGERRQAGWDRIAGTVVVDV